MYGMSTHMFPPKHLSRVHMCQLTTDSLHGFCGLAHQALSFSRLGAGGVLLFLFPTRPGYWPFSMRSWFLRSRRRRTRDRSQQIGRDGARYAVTRAGPAFLGDRKLVSSWLFGMHSGMFLGLVWGYAFVSYFILFHWPCIPVGRSTCSLDSNAFPGLCLSRH